MDRNRSASLLCWKILSDISNRTFNKSLYIVSLQASALILCGGGRVTLRHMANRDHQVGAMKNRSKANILS